MGSAALYDVAVAGAGPSGSTIARRLAEAGRRVYLFDQAMPGGKSVCGGFLGPELEALFESQNLGSQFRVFTKNRISDLAVSGSGTALFHSRFKKSGWAVPRAAFDRWLFELASGAGSTVSPWTRLTSFERKNGVWNLFMQRGKEKFQVRCRHLVLAHGRRPVSSKNTFFACNMIYEGVRMPEDSVMLHFVGKGHVGLNPLGAHKATMCLYVHSDYLKRSDGNLDRMMEGLFLENRHLAHCLEKAERTEEWRSCQAESDGRKEFYKDGIFRVGDAVTMINPIIGGGIPVAIGSASILAELFLKGMDLGWTEERIAGLYERRWENTFRRRLQFGGLLGQVERSALATRSLFFIFKCSPKMLSPLASLSRSL